LLLPAGHAVAGNNYSFFKPMTMEKFMLIFQGGQKTAMTPEELQAHMGKWIAWKEKLEKSGRYVTSDPLFPGGKQVSGPGKTVTDGPYTEGKEVIGGFFIITAKDMAEAVSIAQDCPDYDLGGSVQVRQVMKMDRQPGS
jgi:hypothetical protein